MFEAYADFHVYAQFRHQIFSWGFIYIHSEKAARNLAKKFRYRDFINLVDPSQKDPWKSFLDPSSRSAAQGGRD